MANKPFNPDEFLAAAKPFDPDEFLQGGTPSGTQQNPAAWPAAGSETSSYQTAKDLALIASHEGTFGVWPRILGAADAATSDKSYGQAVDERFALENAAKERVGPFLGNTATAVGGLATGLPLMRSGVTLLGRTAPWTVQRLGANIIEPGLYGAIHGAGGTHSENLPDYIRNASIGFGIGGTLGAALPAAGAAAKGIYQTAADRIAGIPSSLARAARADAPGLASLATHGPEAMLLDAGPSMQSVAQAYVQGTGDYRTKIANALTARDRGTTARSQTAREAALGPAPRISQIEAGLDADRKAVNAVYESHLKGTSIDPQGASQTLAALNTLERNRDVKLNAITDRLTAPGLELSTRQWLNVRHRIDDLADAAGIAGRRNEAAVYGEARRLVDAQIASSAPGVKVADAQFAHIIEQGKALQHGRNIFDTGKEAVHPADIADTIAKGTPEIALRLREGAHTDLERRLGTTTRDLSKLESTIKAPWNQEKATIVFGAQPTADITQSATTNRMFRENYDRIMRGSDTAQRLAAKEENAVSPLPKLAGSMWERLVEKPAGWLINKARTAADERTRAQIADVLTAQGAARDAQAARLLEHNARVIPRGEAYDKYTRLVAQGGLADLLNPFTGER